jgi:hypothetical protein
MANTRNIWKKWKNYFSQLLNVLKVSDVRQMEVHTSEPLTSQPNTFEVEIAIANLDRYNSPGTHQIPSWKFAGSSSDKVDSFNLPNPSSRTMAMGSTQPLTEMSTKNLPGRIKGGQHVRLTNSLPSVSRLSRENVGASTSHNPMGLHGLLQG